MHLFVQIASNCEAVIQYALLRGSKLSPPRVAIPKNSSCSTLQNASFLSNRLKLRGCPTICPPRGVETKPSSDSGSENSSCSTWQNASFLSNRLKLQGCPTICPPRGVETKAFQGRRSEKLLVFYVAKCIIPFKSLETARLSYNMPS